MVELPLKLKVFSSQCQVRNVATRLRVTARTGRKGRGWKFYRGRVGVTSASSSSLHFFYIDFSTDRRGLGRETLEGGSRLFAVLEVRAVRR